jgi:hypothetical protein
MAEFTESEPEGQDSAERLLAVAEESRKKRGRPPGSKNRPKDDDAPVKVNEGNQKRIFAGALRALFIALGAIAGWFGYEYYREITEKEADEGGTLLLPIAQKIGWVATAAFYLAFPAWLLNTMAHSFRKKVDSVEPQASPSPPGSAPSPTPAGLPPVVASNGAPTGGGPGFTEPAQVEGKF